MISCRSYHCVKYGQWLYMMWFMDVSFHLHKEPPPVRASGISRCISCPIRWEINMEPHECWAKDLCAWLFSEHGTHISAEARIKSCDTWFPNVETWRFLILFGETTLLWGSCFREVWKGSALPLWDSFIQPLHLPSHQYSLCATKTQVLADFIITGTGIFNARRKVCRI